MIDRLNEYRVMWILVLYDLPTETKRIGKSQPSSVKILWLMDLPCSNFLYMYAIAPVWIMPKYILNDSIGESVPL